jgi:urease accessory protein
MDLSDAVPHAVWNARLALGYEHRGGRTVLARREHSGPLRVQRDLYPEGAATCHTIIVHPPGGIAGGDALAVDANLGAGAAALLTTPGAGKWYRSSGAAARQSLQFELGAGAVLEWLPQETIVFDGALGETTTCVRLAADAVYMGWDITCFGRAASGERYASATGNWRTRTEVLRDGRRLWLEQGRVAGGDALFESPVGLAGHSVCGTLLAAAPLWTGDEGAGAAALMAACRAVAAGEDGASAGVTRLPGLMIARWLGDNAEDARRYFAALWMLLRPALKRSAATPPRIWAT